jgi:predicted glycosyltransferase
MSRRVFILVTHLLGQGHLSRAAAIGRALARADNAVTLVSGGRASPTVDADGLDLVQLPAVHCRGTDFRTLWSDDGAPATPDLMSQRRERILRAFATARPDVVITELFPFGRRQLADEFEALLRAASRAVPRPAVLASVRDVLAPPSKPERAGEALARLGAYYDGVLVHGDPAIVPLEASWPVDAALARRLTYTGYVADHPMALPAAMAGGGEGAGEILVSGGGSEAGLPLMLAARGAAALMPDGPPWRLLVGHGVTEQEFAALAEGSPRHVAVERARRDFPALLRRAAVSVSQAGYNTMLDLAAAGVPAVVVPFERGRETEQAERALRFAQHGLCAVVREADLSPGSLADAVEAALAAPPTGPVRLRIDGAAGTVRAVEATAAAREAANAASARLDAVLARAAAAGRLPAFWWRDDDCVAPGPALDRLLALARGAHAPLTLAVVPRDATAALAARLAQEPLVSVAVHGWSHVNHAAEGARKQEFSPARPLAHQLEDAGRGLSWLGDLFGAALVPVLVPPWNRIDPALVPGLAGLGYRGLSTFKPRAARAAAPGLIAVNTHLDPVDWRAGGGLAPDAALLATLADLVEDGLAGRRDADEPIGLLTHHLVHDPWVWRFLEALLARLGRVPGLRFVPLAEALGA